MASIAAADAVAFFGEAPQEITQLIDQVYAG
jgi:hypothetical protein